MKKSNIYQYFIIFLSVAFLSGCKIPGLLPENSASPSIQTRHAEYRNTESIAAVSEQPRQIALLLPMTGKHADSAKAIREGFLASYYANTGVKPAVRVYDTTRDGNIQSIYQTAINDGADFVVGPLSKEEVQQLSASSLKTPVLALNYHPGSRPSRNFAQFTLAPESEAEQIADKAWQSGLQSANIIVPDNAWGRRIASAFIARWQAHGGRVLHTVYMSAGYDQSAAVRKMLGIDESQKRANEIKGILSEKVEFQPRRRQDVDMIVMAAPPAQARQLKPLFDFYYAEDVPVYATSSVYSGNPNPRTDRDINGVIFCDMPWLLNQNQGAHVRQLLANKGSSQSDDYKRLFAMGVDAYQLTGQMRYLQSNPNAAYPGATGYLSLGPNNQVQRKLAWAKISDGVPVSIN